MGLDSDALILTPCRESRIQAVNWSPWHHRLHRTLLQNPALLPDQSRLLLAISGGQDSMALMTLLISLRRLHGWTLLIWHGDHNWHCGSDRIACELRDWCLDIGLPWHSDRADPTSVATEATARQWRYEQLGRHAHNQGCDVVTAHTASDRAETQLLQLARGTDLAGLGCLRAIRLLDSNYPEGAQLRRPLLSFTRSETAQICSELQVPVWIDPSNSSTRPARNRIRHDVLPILEELYPGCSERMANFAERISHMQDTQAEITDLALEHLTTHNCLDRQKWKRLAVSTREQLLARWLRREGGLVIQAKHLNKIGYLAHAKTGITIQLADGWAIKVETSTILLQNI